MTFNASDIHDNVVTVPQQLGIFDSVLGFEPKSAPVGNLICAVWFMDINPFPGRSGANITSAVAVWNARIYIPMLSEPQDEVEKNLLNAISLLMGALAGDFTLDSSVAGVDLQAMSGKGMGSKTGYVGMDGVLFRIADVTIPLIIDDCWSQTA